jgi:hypothetical protein
VFLSACLAAAASGDKRNGLPGAPGDKDPVAGVRGEVAYSLAEALVDAGPPGALGWDGSVADAAATAFAATLYDGLEGRQDLADAVGTARRGLLNAPEEVKRRDWHLARRWLGSQGGGPIVGGNVRRDTRRNGCSRTQDSLPRRLATTSAPPLSAVQWPTSSKAAATSTRPCASRAKS